MVRSKFSNSEEISMFNSDNENEIEATVNFNAIGAIVDRLTDIYENPAVAATRETFSNAYDATMRAYKKDGIKNPITIEIPVMSNNYKFSISDNGSGMSREDVINVYRVYGETTKNNDLSSTGSFGIGAKAPLAIVKSFDVVTVKDGQETSFSFVRNVGQLPKIYNLNTVETKAKNGTKVSYQIVSDDEYNDYEKQEMINDIIKTSIMLKNFSVDFDVVISNLELADLSYFNYSDNIVNSIDFNKDYTHALNILHEDENYRLFIKNSSVASNFVYNIENNAEKLVENMTYLLNGYLYYDDYRDLDYIFELKVGAVDFPSSRDKILTNSKFINLKKSIKDSITTENMVKIIASVLSNSSNSEVGSFVKNNYSNTVRVGTGENKKYKNILSFIYEYNNSVSDSGKIVRLSEDFEYFANNLSNYFISDSAYKGKIPMSGYSFDKSNSKALYDSPARKKHELNKMFKNDLMYFNGLIKDKETNDESLDVEQNNESNYYNYRALDVNDTFFSSYKKPTVYLVLDGYSKHKEDIAKYSSRIDTKKILSDNLSERDENTEIYKGEDVNVIIPHNGLLTKDDKEFIKRVENITTDKFVIISNEEKIPFKKRLSNYDTSRYFVSVYSSVDDCYESLVNNINKNGYNMTNLFSKHVAYDMTIDELVDTLENWNTDRLKQESLYKEENENINSYDNIIIMINNSNNLTDREITQIVNSYIEQNDNSVKSIIGKRFFVTDYIKVKSLQKIVESGYKVYRHDSGKKVAKYYDNISCLNYKNVDEEKFRHYLSVANDENKINLYNSFISNMRSISHYSYDESSFNKSIVAICEYIDNNNAQLSEESKNLLEDKKSTIDFIDTIKNNRYNTSDSSYLDRMVRGIKYSTNESDILNIILKSLDTKLIDTYGLSEKHKNVMDLQDYENRCRYSLDKGLESARYFIDTASRNNAPVETVIPYIDFIIKKSLQ